MDVREQCRFLTRSISPDGEVGWDTVEQANEPDRPQLAVGDVVADRYRIEAFVQRGGMGEVYRATDELLDVEIAVKIVRPNIAWDPAVLRRFKQEVLLARSVTHPNVCRIYHLGWDEARGLAYLTMEFLRGESLRSRIVSRGPLGPVEALPLIRQLAEGLDAAHRAGILHRDFKTGNVMLVPGPDGERAVILDFGLALELEPESSAPRQPRTRGVVGTPAYMSPEQVTGGPLGPASDLYALGVVLFEVSTGRLPFEFEAPLRTALAHVDDPPPSPRCFVDMDPIWEQTILRLLSKEPAGRFATAADVVLTLEGRSSDRDAARPAPRHALPAERDAFVGRTDELESMAGHLEGSGGQVATRLLTLQGPGGTGKTRLAQKYGWQNLSLWPGGVWFCDLSDARGVEGTAKAVATTLSVPLSREDPIAQLGHAISGRGRCLVILDNFEQVVDHAEATLGRWLARAPEARFLVTSRERLRLPEETVHVVEPLDPTSHGVELFGVRAQGHHPGFQVDASNRGMVEEIVRRLDGLPLAIELAAARLKMLSLEQLRERLEDRFRILGGGKGRHGTLRATLDWSWELLRPWEQSAIAQASVFEGGFTLEAAEAVLSLSDEEEEPSVLDVLQSLSDKSWIHTRVALGNPRFEMYDTIREYASAKLRGDPSKNSAGLRDAEIRHGAYFTGTGLEQTIQMMKRHRGVARQAVLQLEFHNLVAACQRAIGRGDEETAVVAYEAADYVLAFRGPFLVRTQLGSEVLGVLGDQARRGRALTLLGNAHFDLGDYETATEQLSEAAEITGRQGDLPVRARSLQGLGNVALRRGDLDAALSFFEESVSASKEIGDEDGVATRLVDVGLVRQKLGEVGAAAELFRQGLAIHEARGNRTGQAVCLNALGDVAYRQGRYSEARQCFGKTLAVCREIGDRTRAATVLGNLGNVASALGENEESLRYYSEALEQHREIGDRFGCAAMLNNLAYFPFIAGDLAGAQVYVEESLEIAGEIGLPGVEVMNLNNLGMFAQLEGGHARARARFEEALAVARRHGDPWDLARTLCGLGSTCLALGELETGRGHLLESLNLSARVEATTLQLEALIGMSLLYFHLGRPERSARLLALVDKHPAMEEDVRVHSVVPLREKLKGRLTEAALVAAEEQARHLDLTRAVSEVLEDEEPDPR